MQAGYYNETEFNQGQFIGEVHGPFDDVIAATLAANVAGVESPCVFMWVDRAMICSQIGADPIP